MWWSDVETTHKLVPLMPGIVAASLMTIMRRHVNLTLVKTHFLAPNFISWTEPKSVWVIK